MNLSTESIARQVHPDFDQLSDNVRSELLGQVYRIEQGHQPGTEWEKAAHAILNPAPKTKATPKPIKAK